MTDRRNYKQSFKASYSAEYPCIVPSKLGNFDAHCVTCACDFSISHGGKSDVVRHINSIKHKKKHESSNVKKKMNDFFSNNEDTNTIKAECAFTAFLVEHNIALNASDHAGKLFRIMFPDSTIAKNYGCGRTKTTAIVQEMAKETEVSLIDAMNVNAYSIAVDGSNDTNSKLHPIVVTYFNEAIQKMENYVLAFIVVKDGCTGINIANSIINKFEELHISFEKCVSFGSDNAPVMLGPHKGVQKYLKEKQEELIAIGCPCHLLNLAAKKGTNAIDFPLDQAIIDIFYYLEFSGNRKEKLKFFQDLHGVEARKILKHASTRWLSLGRCLDRILENWNPLLSFFLSEVKNEKLPLNLKSYKIPKLVSSDGASKNLNSEKTSSASSSTTSKKRKLNNHQPSNVKKLKDSASKNEPSPGSFIKREEKIFYFLSSNLNKAYCAFILFSNKELDKTNVYLQSSSPLIHCLKQTLIDCLRNILLCFTDPVYMKEIDLTKVPYGVEKNQKKDEDLRVGSAASNIVNELSTEEKKTFYSHVRKYYVAVCDYIIQKFPITSEVLENAEVADLTKISSKSFSSVKYFVKKFPFLLYKENNESDDDAWDTLETEFCNLQIENIIHTKEPMDKQIHNVNKILGIEGKSKYNKITKVLLAILTIPHSNAECERVFSMVKKNRTQFRSSMSDETLEKLLIVKCKENVPCFDSVFSKSFLQAAKKATSVALKK